MLNKISIVGFALCFALCVYLSGAFGYANDFCETKFAGTNSKTAMNNNNVVFACIPTALTKEQRERNKVLTNQLIAPKPGFKELPDGYSLSYTANEQNLKDIAEFVANERLCCPFLSFDIAVEGENIDLRLRGPEGAKDFIKAEFGV